MGLSNAILQLGLGGRDPRRRLGNLPEKEKIPHRGEHRQEVGEKLGYDKVV